MTDDLESAKADLAAARWDLKDALNGQLKMAKQIESLEEERDRLRQAVNDIWRGAQHTDVGHEDFRASAMQISWDALNGGPRQ